MTATHVAQTHEPHAKAVFGTGSVEGTESDWITDGESILGLEALGRYQRSLEPIGRARWSGSDLKGKARKWAGSYAQQRASLLRRCNANRFLPPWLEVGTGLLSSDGHIQRLFCTLDLYTPRPYGWESGHQHYSGPYPIRDAMRAFMDSIS